VPPGPAGTGTVEKLGDMDMYVAGPPGATKAIVLVYDIMGMSPSNTQHNCGAVL